MFRMARRRFELLVRVVLIAGRYEWQLTVMLYVAAREKADGTDHGETSERGDSMKSTRYVRLHSNYVYSVSIEAVCTVVAAEYATRLASKASYMNSRHLSRLNGCLCLCLRIRLCLVRFDLSHKAVFQNLNELV